MLGGVSRYGLPNLGTALRCDAHPGLPLLILGTTQNVGVRRGGLNVRSFGDMVLTSDCVFLESVAFVLPVSVIRLCVMARSLMTLETLTEPKNSALIDSLAL